MDLCEARGAVHNKVEWHSYSDVVQVCELFALADKALVDGADEFLQLLHVAGSMQKVFNG
jgi:hypothetical protein